MSDTDDENLKTLMGVPRLAAESRAQWRGQGNETQRNFRSSRKGEDDIQLSRI